MLPYTLPKLTGNAFGQLGVVQCGCGQQALRRLRSFLEQHLGHILASVWIMGERFLFYYYDIFLT